MGSLIGAICGATAGLLWLLIRLMPRDWLAIYKDGMSIVYMPFFIALCAFVAGIGGALIQVFATRILVFVRGRKR